jgi:hypothetical protein
MDGCEGQLSAVAIPGEAFKKAACGRDPYPTCKCDTCGKLFGHKDVMRERIYTYARENNISVSAKEIDDYRCQLPGADFSHDPREQVLFALNLLDYQFHHATHTGEGIR